MIVHARHANNSHNNISSAVPESPPPNGMGAPPNLASPQNARVRPQVCLCVGFVQV